MTSDMWVVGRAFVFAEAGEVEYFFRFEENGTMIRSFCSGLRPLELCRPLDYVCDPKYLRNRVRD